VVTYPVQIEFDSGTTPVKVGMSATADIQVQKIENAILAPSRAVQTSGTTKESAMTTDQSVFKHVKYAWDDAVAAALDPVGRLVYRSNILGADGRITNTGGGNTSSKIVLPDPLTGNETEVLWVKGSGGDLRTARRDNFASLYLDKLRGLQQHYHHAPQRGTKSAIEDAIVGLYPHATFNLNPRPASIDTPLHAFVPFRHVDHMHPNAVIAIAAARNSERLTRAIYGDDVIWKPWQRPGFDLGLVLEQICTDHPQAKGVILGSHGLINWADDDKACYELTLALIERATRCWPTSPTGPASARCSRRLRCRMAGWTRWRSRPASSCHPTRLGASAMTSGRRRSRLT
jgi:rhamnose utilization protein RhaD (predicted bifunctional aldolase and dehydrogenase)